MQLPQWFQILTTILFALVGLIVFGASFKVLWKLLKKGIQWKFGHSKLIIGSDTQTTIKENPHVNCPNFADVIVLLNNSSKLYHEKFVLQYMTQIRDQMNYAEQKADELRFLLLSFYLKLLEQKGISGVVGSISASCYRLVLKDVSSELLKLVRQSFRENHFIDMNESSFNAYVNDKFEFLKSTGSELLNQSYFYDADIPREELYSYNLEHLLQIKEILFHVYARAKELALEYKEKERLLDEKLEKIFERHVG
jgi:hypothetical protein